jgi:hypothetical protein
MEMKADLQKCRLTSSKQAMEVIQEQDPIPNVVNVVQVVVMIRSTSVMEGICHVLD